MCAFAFPARTRIIFIIQKYCPFFFSLPRTHGPPAIVARMPLCVARTRDQAGDVVLIDRGYSFPRPTGLDRIDAMPGLALRRFVSVLHALNFYCVFSFERVKKKTQILRKSLFFCGLRYQRQKMGEDDVQQGSPLGPFIFSTECLPKTTRPPEHFIGFIISSKTTSLELRFNPLFSHVLIIFFSALQHLLAFASFRVMFPFAFAPQFNLGLRAITRPPPPKPPTTSSSSTPPNPHPHTEVASSVWFWECDTSLDPSIRRGGILPLELMSLRMSSYCRAINSPRCTGWESQRTETEAETWESDPISVHSCARMSGCFVITHVFSSFLGAGRVPTYYTTLRLSVGLGA